MSFNRSGYIGRAPGDSSVTIARKSYEPTGVQTSFTFSAGYDPGYCDVYLNGIKLINGNDYTASDGSTVGLTSEAQNGDIVEIVAYKAFNLGQSITYITGDLTITDTLTATNVSGTTSVTAGYFYGDGANITGLSFAGAGITQYIDANSLTVTGSPGVSTITRLGATDLNVTGIITANGLSGNVSGAACTFTTGTFNSDVSIGGTLSYQDVTNVDAVGLITARSGVNLSGGQLTVGTAYSVGNAGVVTAQNVTISAGTIDLKNSGSVSNIKFYCESANAHYTALQSAAHSAYGGNVTITLPTTTDTLVARTTTDTLTNKTLTSPTLTTPSFSGAVTGEFKVGTALTIGSAGLTTFAGDVDFSGVTASMVWDRSDDALEFADNVEANWGSSSDLKIYHSSSNAASYIQNSQGNLFIEAPNRSAFKLRKNGTAETMILATAGGSCELYEDNTKRLETTTYGAKVTGIGSFTTSVYLNTNGTYLAENVISFEPSGIAYIDHRTVGQNITFRMSSGSALDTNAIIVGATGITTFSDTPHDDKGDLRSIPLNTQGSTYTLVAADAGKAILASGTVTVPNSVFSAGDAVTIINNTGSNLTITKTITTMYNASDATSANRTLATRGTCTIYFESGTIAYISGAGLS